MRPISNQKKTRILEMLFSGETYGTVSVKADCSKSTVKKIFDEFVDLASSSSLEEAAENYGVPEEIEVLRDIACEAKETGSSFPDLLRSARRHSERHPSPQTRTERPGTKDNGERICSVCCSGSGKPSHKDST